MRKLATRLDLDEIVFDGDRDLRAALLRDKRFAKIIAARAAAPRSAHRRRLLQGSLRMSPNMAPDVFASLEHVRSVLGLDAPVELFCVPEREINAFVVPPERGAVLLGLSSAALEGLSNAELRFVLGHELGHAVFDHFLLSPDELVEEDGIAPIHVVRLCAWRRYAELSADRVGLLCTDGFDTAVCAFFKLTSGLSDRRFLQHAEQSAEQYAALRAEGIESDSADWFSTHPYGPLRVKALDLFSRSETYHRLARHSTLERSVGKLLGRPDLTEAELEREVSAVMRLMDPSFLNDSGPDAAAIRELLALVGMAVALADGTVTRGEKRVLGRLVGKRGVIADAAGLLELSEEKHWERIEKLAGDLRMHLSLGRRAKVVEDLVAVALADNDLAEEEVAVLDRAAELLDVPPVLVYTALQNALAGLD